MKLGPFEVSGSYTGDCMALLPQVPDGSIQCVVTSPPYFGLRSYLPDDHPDKVLEIGTEETPDEYVEKMVAVFREVRRVLRDDGTLWLNLGDSYANDGKWGGATSGKHARGLHGGSGIGRGRQKTGLKPKDLIAIPWRVALALQADGWFLRSDIVWAKRNAMPESVRDRPTRAHEFVFLLAKRPTYFYDWFAARERAVASHASGNDFRRPERKTIGGRGQAQEWRPENTDGMRNLRSVWTAGSEAYRGAHFAVSSDIRN